MQPPGGAPGMLAEIERIEFREAAILLRTAGHVFLRNQRRSLVQDREFGKRRLPSPQPAPQAAGMFLDIMAWDRLLLFTGGELLFSLTPGPTVVMISAYGFRGGFRDALAAICGTQTGNGIWYLLCALGLGALAKTSPLAFAVLRTLGAAY